MGYVASHRVPSTDLQEPCRLDLHERVSAIIQVRQDVGLRVRTKADSWVLIANILTLLVGEEHVCRETTLRRVGIYKVGQLKDNALSVDSEVNIPFFFFSTPRVFLGAAALVLGMAAAGGLVLALEALGGMVIDAEGGLSRLRRRQVVQMLWE